MQSALFLAGLTYPLWGFILLILLCRRLAVRASTTQRSRAALIAATVSTVVFSPVAWGGEGFGFFVPWLTMLFDPRHTAFLWELPVFVFVAAFLICLRSGGPAVPSTPS